MSEELINHLLDRRTAIRKIRAELKNRMLHPSIRYDVALNIALSLSIDMIDAETSFLDTMLKKYSN